MYTMKTKFATPTPRAEPLTRLHWAVAQVAFLGLKNKKNVYSPPTNKETLEWFLRVKDTPHTHK